MGHALFHQLGLTTPGPFHPKQHWRKRSVPGRHLRRPWLVPCRMSQFRLGSSETETLESAWANQKGTLAPGAHGDDDNDRRTLRAAQTSGVGLGQVLTQGSGPTLWEFTKGASFVNGFLFWGILELCQIPRLSNPPVIS